MSPQNTTPSSSASVPLSPSPGTPLPASVSHEIHLSIKVTSSKVAVLEFTSTLAHGCWGPHSLLPTPEGPCSIQKAPEEWQCGGLCASARTAGSMSKHSGCRGLKAHLQSAPQQVLPRAFQNAACMRPDPASSLGIRKPHLHPE